MVHPFLFLVTLPNSFILLYQIGCLHNDLWTAHLNAAYIFGSFLLGINYDESYQIAKQILKGVDFIHAENYFHRDLKVGWSQDFFIRLDSFQ